MANLLVIDDEGDIRHLYAAELEDEGHTVVACGSSQEAMEQLRSQAFDLIVLDIQLDQESGLELLQKITREQENIPVILCTGYSSPITELDKGISGIKAVLRKPLLLNDLMKTVRKVLDQG